VTGRLSKGEASLCGFKLLTSKTKSKKLQKLPMPLLSTEQGRKIRVLWQLITL
jgi:hypothetical protein